MVIKSKKRIRYFDKKGNEIVEGCTVRYKNGTCKKVYSAQNGRLGTNKSTPTPNVNGKGKFGVFPFTAEETAEIEVVKAANGKREKEKGL